MNDPMEAPLAVRGRNDPEHQARLRFPAFLVGAFLVSCLAMVLLARLSLSRSRAQYQRQAEITAQNLCTVLADDLVTSYEKIDLAVLGLQDEVEQRLASGPIDRARLEAFIRRQHARIPDFSALRVVNADGIVEYGKDDPSGPRIDLSDREYFLRLKREPGAGLVFSKPLIGRVRAVWVVMLARRVSRPDGSFAGMVYGTLDLGKLRERFATLSIGRDGVVALRDPEFAVIIRRGGTGDATGQTAVSADFRALARSGVLSGTYRAVTALDRVPRIYAFIRLQPYGHFLSVGLGQAEALAPWRRECLRTWGFVALSILVTGAATGMALRGWRRQQRAEAERERVILDLQTALAEVKALSGMLPICSSCKKIRDDQGYWNQLEAYLVTHTEAQFTHGICPDCAKAFYPSYFEDQETGAGELP